MKRTLALAVLAALFGATVATLAAQRPPKRPVTVGRGGTYPPRMTPKPTPGRRLVPTPTPTPTPEP